MVQSDINHYNVFSFLKRPDPLVPTAPYMGTNSFL